MQNKFIKKTTVLILFFLFITFFNFSIHAIVYPWETGQQFIFPQFSGQSYTVQPGDSLYSIARRFQVNITELRQENNIWNNNIFPGQRLTIPGKQQQNNYTVQRGDSLYSIARRFQVNITDLRRENNIWNNNIYPGQRLTIPGRQQQNTYTVQWGDSLFSIARRFNTTVNNIRNINSLTTDNLTVGQTLLIPGSTTVNNKTIVIDAGHGGRDPGAVTYYNSRLVKESDIVLDISNRLADLLREGGYRVIKTRTADYNVSLWQRVQLAYQHNADLFVSIHTDNSPNPVTGGSNVYVRPGANWNTYQLAESIQINLEQITNRPTNILGRVIRQPFTVVMQSRPAVLVETGFLSNWHDISRFQTAEFRYLIARGIYNGIEKWLN